MATYKIITDSSCDFTKEQYAKLDLIYVPLTLLYKGESHDSFTENQELKKFYDGIRAGEIVYDGPTGEVTQEILDSIYNGAAVPQAGE